MRKARVPFVMSAAILALVLGSGVALGAAKIDKAAIDAALSRFTESKALVGVSALVYEEGHEAYFGAFGQADREAGKPMTRDTLVQIFSMTKPIAGVALMSLYEAGKGFLPTKGQVGFGIDFAVRIRPPANAQEASGAVGEFFWDGAADTLFWIDPKNKITAVLFTQYKPFGKVALHKAFRDAVYSRIPGALAH
jgi:CubicO group peptidase (beta-lactamase class C family)